MTALAPFRSFTNTLGLSPNVVIYPISKKQHNLTASVEIFSYWYWRLAKLTICYHYSVNDYHVERTVVATDEPYTLKDRIRGDFEIIYPKTIDAKGEITTEVHFLPCQPYDANSPYADIASAYNAQQHFIQSEPLLCKGPISPFNKTFCLTLQFLEDGGGDFCLYTLPIDHCGKISSIFHANFMDQQLPIYFSTPYPDNIQGTIHSFAIKPEFYEIEK